MGRGESSERSEAETRSCDQNLPEAFSRDADRVSRLQREAEVLASLNRPNIASIYDDQEAHGARFLIRAGGRRLADRITRGPVPAGEALAIALQICKALETARGAHDDFLCKACPTILCGKSLQRAGDS